MSDTLQNVKRNSPMFTSPPSVEVGIVEVTFVACIGITPLFFPRSITGLARADPVPVLLIGRYVSSP